MENASRALLIAAGILIGLIVVTMIVYGYNQISSYYATKEEAKESEQLVDFNKQYIGYNRDDVRGSDLISLVNKIIDYNSVKMNDVNDEKIEISITIPRNADKVQNFYFNTSETLVKLGYTYSADTFETEILDVAVNGTSTTKSIEAKYPNGMATKLANNLSTLLGENSSKTRDELLKELKIDYSVDNSDILKYYQYVQLKRAHFDCTDLTYKKGRVKSFTFVFNGTFE